MLHTLQDAQVASPPTPERREAAERRAERIRQGMSSLAATIKDLATAYAERDWEVLGHGTWDAYVEAEFGTHRVKLPAAERVEVIEALRVTGMSQRAIAQSLGISQATVHRDLRSATDSGESVDLERVASLDGKDRRVPQQGPVIDVVPTLDELTRPDADSADAAASAEPEAQAPEAHAAEQPDADVAQETCPSCSRKLGPDGSCAACAKAADSNLKSLVLHVEQATRYIATIGIEFERLPESHRSHARTQIEQLSGRAAGLRQRVQS